MRPQSNPPPTEIRDSLLKTYAINDAMNQLILSDLDPRAWRAEPPGEKGSGRTIAAIFAHLHNSRLVWLRNSAPHLKCPTPLDPDRCTMKQAAVGAQKKRRAVPRDAHRRAFRRIPSAASRYTRAGVGRPLGPPTPPCSRTCSRTRPITAAKSCCSPTSSAIASSTPPPASGTGTNSGKRPASRSPARAEPPGNANLPIGGFALRVPAPDSGFRLVVRLLLHLCSSVVPRSHGPCRSTPVLTEGPWPRAFRPLAFFSVLVLAFWH